MNRGTASVVQLGKGVTAGSFSGLNVLTNVILGKKEALQKDFNGLVLTDLVMLGKKISHITIITVTVGPAVSPLLLPDAIADSLAYVKAYGGTEQNGTPTPTSPVDIVCNNGTLKVKDSELSVGYKRLQNVKTSGDVRYVSNVYLTGGDTLRFSFQAAAGNLLGCYNNPSANDNYSFYNTTNATGSYARYNGQTGGSSTYTGTTYNVTMSPTGITGTRNPSSFTPSEFTCSVPFCIFATSLTVSEHPNATIIGNIEVSGSQNLKFIPCERVSDGAIGFWETSNQEFLEKQGTGTPTTDGYDTSYMTETYVDGTVETVSVIPNERENHFVQYINAYLRSSTRSIVAYNGNSVVTFDCEVGKTYCCINRAMLGNSTMVNIGYSDTIPTTGYVYAQNDFEATSIVDGFYKTTGLVFTAKKRYATFIFRYDKDSSQTPTSMLEQMIFYETSKAQSATCEPLLAVGDYKDVQEILSGAITRNVGIKVLDGTENLTEKDQYSRVSIQITDMLNPTSARGLPAFCNYFENLHNSEPISTITAGQFYLASPQRVYFHINQSTTTNEFKAYLADQYAAGTPVIVIYPLATATTESVAGQTLQVQNGDNTLEITQASLNGLELEAQYEQGVQASVQEIEP